MHTISYKFTSDYNENLPNNNYSEETTELTFDGNDYDFIDYLNDHHVYFIKDGNEYIVLDEDDDETGERYIVVSDTKKYFRVLRHTAEFNLRKHGKHLSSDWILNESEYSINSDPVELGRFDTLEAARVLFENEKADCDSRVLKGNTGWYYLTNILEIEEITVEVDEDFNEEIVDGDFWDYYTVPYEPKQDEEDDEEEEDE